MSNFSNFDLANEKKIHKDLPNQAKFIKYTMKYILIVHLFDIIDINMEYWIIVWQVCLVTKLNQLQFQKLEVFFMCLL